MTDEEIKAIHEYRLSLSSKNKIEIIDTIGHDDAGITLSGQGLDIFRGKKVRITIEELAEIPPNYKDYLT